MPGSNKRHLRREQRRRVDTLHRVQDSGGGGALITGGELVSTKGLASRPFTLDREVWVRARKRGRTHPAFLHRARDRAEEVSHQEPNAGVLAAFGVERAAQEALWKIPFDLGTPDYFHDGEALEHDQVGGGGLQPADWNPRINARLGKSLRQLKVNLKTVRSSGILPARWSPRRSLLGLEADVVHPPMEALALGAQLLRADHLLSPAWGEIDLGGTTVLAIGLGHTASTEALSFILRDHFVYHIPIPYQAQVWWPSQEWETMFINVPSRHQWQVARLLAGHGPDGYLARRAILRGDRCRKDGTGHVPHLLSHVLPHVRRGLPLVIMGAPEPYHAAVSALRSEDRIKPITVKGIDTACRPIWVGYKDGTRPWAPYGLPRPTGRLVSIWRWSR